ncbi:MAG: hypothetical protein PVF05_11075 [Gemmatimonadales bacterium]|jgi:TolB protein
MKLTFNRDVVRASRALLVAAAALLLATPLAAQDRGDVRLGITYSPGFQPGLVITAVGHEVGMGEVARTAEAILRADLLYADRFEIIPIPDSVRTGEGVNYALWNQLGAVWLVNSEITGTAAAPVLRVSLHDVVFGELKEVRSFPLPAVSARDFRMAVHHVSDQVVEWATGDPGIAATRIVFRRKSGEGSDIYAIDYDGENLARLTSENTIVYSPALSPGGSHLLYVSYDQGWPVVYEKNLATGARRTISAVQGLNVTPIYSPDGSKILLARTAGDHTELFEFQRNPLGAPRRITYTSSGETLNPAYSPDGSRLAITSSPLGLPQIYVMSASGSGAPQLISRYVYGERGYATSPDWAPENNRIAYQAWVDSSFQVVTVSPNGADRRVMTSAGSNEDPSWAPDGRHVVFSSAGERGHSLLILDTVGGTVRTLTSGQVDQLPDWSGPLP